MTTLFVLGVLWGAFLLAVYAVADFADNRSDPNARYLSRLMFDEWVDLEKAKEAAGTLAERDRIDEMASQLFRGRFGLDALPSEKLQHYTQRLRLEARSRAELRAILLELAAEAVQARYGNPSTEALLGLPESEPPPVNGRQSGASATEGVVENDGIAAVIGLLALLVVGFIVAAMNA